MKGGGKGGRPPNPPPRGGGPVVALLLSGIWPGLGQAYNGPTEKKKGAIMAVTQGGLWVMTIAGAAKSTTQGGRAHINPLVWVGFIGILGNNLYSMYDAGTRASAINAANGFSLLPPGFHGHSVGLVVDPAILPRGELGMRAAVQMRF